MQHHTSLVKIGADNSISILYRSKKYWSKQNTAMLTKYFYIFLCGDNHKTRNIIFFFPMTEISLRVGYLREISWDSSWYSNSFKNISRIQSRRILFEYFLEFVRIRFLSEISWDFSMQSIRIPPITGNTGILREYFFCHFLREIIYWQKKNIGQKVLNFTESTQKKVNEV